MGGSDGVEGTDKFPRVIAYFLEFIVEKLELEVCIAYRDSSYLNPIGEALVCREAA